MRDLRSAHGLRTSLAGRSAAVVVVRCCVPPIRRDTDPTIDTTDTTDSADTTDSPSPADAIGPPVAVAPVGRVRRLHLVTVAVATVAVVVALVGLVWGTRPLQTPTQDCGTSFSFLLDGRVDEFVDPANPPAGITAADAEANNAEPCQERAADRARPAGALVVGGTLLAATAAVVDLGARGLRWYRNTHMPPVHDHLPL